jgi:UDP-N-acetyl-D-glucosamine dehydrogenase
MSWWFNKMLGNVSVIGQGYVGLPLALASAKVGFNVTGIDSNNELVEKLNKGQSTIKDVLSSTLQEVILSGNYSASNSYDSVANANIVIVCVPTPLNSSNKPDLSYLESAVVSLTTLIEENVLIVIESTVAPETTRKIVLPLIKNLIEPQNKKFHLAFSPERIDPSNQKWNIFNTPKLVAGLTEISCEMACTFYSSFVSNIIKCNSLEIAETAKLLENSFRFINISFVNQISMFCSKLGIDINEVISAASTKPYGFMSFYPSAGVGGHCIPVDPLYLSDKAREIGSALTFIDLAEGTNASMPLYFVEKAANKLGDLRNKNILVVGVAYKSNVSDVRETPAKQLISQLRSRGAQVFWHDELVVEWNGEKSVNISKDYDLAILLTLHDSVDLTQLGDVPVLNTRGSL